MVKLKVLIISNEFCSGSTANGRTLMNMLKGFKPEELAHFALHGYADKNFCNN